MARRAQGTPGAGNQAIKGGADSVQTITLLPTPDSHCSSFAKLISPPKVTINCRASSPASSAVSLVLLLFSPKALLPVVVVVVVDLKNSVQSA